ncbi:MAG: hypothetical protein HQK51_03460 [Oligoflexia bacterium]|nr:hypothetical protein [Oligoflexia bacterium]
MKIICISENIENIEHFSKLFKAHFPKVQLISVTNQKAAFDLLTIDGPFGVIMIDTTMRHLDPSSVAEKLIDFTGSRPIVFFGPRTFVESRVRDIVFQGHEANQLLFFPFDGMDFKQKLENAIRWIEKEDFEQSILEVNVADYLPIKIKNFYMYDSIPYDAFLDIGNEKFVKVIAKNKKYTYTLLRQYIQKDVKNLFLYRDETIRFLESAIQMINEKIEKILSVSPLTDYNEKNFNYKALIELQIGGVTILHQVIRTIGVLDSVKRLTDNIIATSIHLFDRSENVEKVIRVFPYKEKGLAENAVLTNYICLAIIANYGWDSKTTRNKLGLASLIHDAFLTNDKIIKVYSPDDPALNEFTVEEHEEYRTHTERGANLVNYFSGYSDVDFIISQHHERPNGKGFPNHISALKITSFSAIFILANKFACNFLELWKGNSVHKVIKHIMKEMVVDFNVGNYKDPLKALEKSMIGYKH